MRYKTRSILRKIIVTILCHLVILAVAAAVLFFAKVLFSGFFVMYYGKYAMAFHLALFGIYSLYDIACMQRCVKDMYNMFPYMCFLLLMTLVLNVYTYCVENSNTAVLEGIFLPGANVALVYIGINMLLTIYKVRNGGRNGNIDVARSC